MHWMKVPEAANYMGCCQMNVYKQMSRGVLKYKLIRGVKHTCPEYIQEYWSALHSKQEHSVFNGRPVYDESRGELSVEMCARQLGVERCSVHFACRTGRLKCIRRGRYFVVTQEDLNNYKAQLEEKKLYTA